jgi:excisionase family DNA binding protein
MLDQKRERESLQLLSSDNPQAKIAVGTREAASLSGISERTIQQYIAAKLLPARKIGKRRLILLRDLEKFLRKDQPYSISTPNALPKSASEGAQSQNAGEGCGK